MLIYPIAIIVHVQMFAYISWILIISGLIVCICFCSVAQIASGQNLTQVRSPAVIIINTTNGTSADNANTVNLNLLLALTSTTGIIGAIAGTIVSHYFNLRAKESENKIQLRNELRKDRVECYNELMSHLGGVTKFPSKEPLKNIPDLEVLIKELVTWYHDQKGAFLMSRNSLRLFEQLLVLLNRIHDTHRNGLALEENEINQIINSKELLRQSFLNDIGSEDDKV